MRRLLMQVLTQVFSWSVRRIDDRKDQQYARNEPRKIVIEVVAATQVASYGVGNLGDGHQDESAEDDSCRLETPAKTAPVTRAKERARVYAPVRQD